MAARDALRSGGSAEILIVNVERPLRACSLFQGLAFGFRVNAIPGVANLAEVVGILPWCYDIETLQHRLLVRLLPDRAAKIQGFKVMLVALGISLL